MKGQKLSFSFRRQLLILLSLTKIHEKTGDLPEENENFTFY